ncbi:hypothetical protein B0H15DRAFT_947839 [Mycena belliarum]|uniref:Uncharacterized protein n=1 Tax=Mycena belliarum TaxID=1033014 RepID=A0AAD6U8W6_9AGAR|nr:hypothetical protein B0H15DRAFT_947839 [Mycena belliae]
MYFPAPQALLRHAPTRKIDAPICKTTLLLTVPSRHGLSVNAVGALLLVFALRIVFDQSIVRFLLRCAVTALVCVSDLYFYHDNTRRAQATIYPILMYFHLLAGRGVSLVEADNIGFLAPT